MVDHLVERPRADVEARKGLAQRRRWSDPEKGRIVAESLAPGAVVSKIAERHQITPRHLSTWRKAAREGRLTLPGHEMPLFVPVLSSTLATDKGAKLNSTSIAIEVAGVVVRAGPGVDFDLLRDVLRAIKAAT
jgi:transposase